MENLKGKIKKAASLCFEEMVNLRNTFHKFPELGYEEYKTAELIASKLKEYNIPFQTGIAKTGVVGLIEGKKPNSYVIALRADMDALPIHEKNKTIYTSQHEGVMHACGHDVHMACLLGAAKILSEFKEEFSGSIKLIFQPSEEKFPGGALQMIKEGVLKNPTVDVIIGQHVLPTLACGKVGMKSGMYMASTDEIYITVKGKGGHAATPDLLVNPLMVASEILLELNNFVNNYEKSNIPTVLAFGRITGDGRTNIVPDEVKIEGTLRTFNEEWRKQAHQLIQNIANEIAIKWNASCEVYIDKGYPFLVNDELLTNSVCDLSKNFLGTENVVSLEQRMTAEDFAYFSHEIPSVFYRLGVQQRGTTDVRNLHTSTFDIDESAIITGIEVMTWLAIKCLNTKA